MPNWVLNSVKVEGDKKQIKDLFEMFKDGVDFEKIDKMPEEIKNTTSPNRDAESRIEMKQKYGAEDWYDWACQHWGTKWNVIPKETLINSELQTMEFNTAWATPIEFFQSLSKKYPDLSFEVQFADEDLGNNCGVVTYKNGEYTEDYIPEEGSDEAEKFANELWGWEE